MGKRQKPSPQLFPPMSDPCHSFTLLIDDWSIHSTSTSLGVGETRPCAGSWTRKFPGLFLTLSPSVSHRLAFLHPSPLPPRNPSGSCGSQRQLSVLSEAQGTSLAHQMTLRKSLSQATPSESWRRKAERSRWAWL